MQVETIRRIDGYVGIPLCWMLTLVRRAYAFVSTKPILPRPRKVLIIKLSEMGSTVLAYPARGVSREMVEAVLEHAQRSLQTEAH